MELSLIHAVNTGKMTLEEAKKAEAAAASQVKTEKAVKTVKKEA